MGLGQNGMRRDWFEHAALRTMRVLYPHHPRPAHRP